MPMVKGTLLGGILTWVLALIIGSQGSSGGQLAIHRTFIAGHDVYWSWPLFFAAAGLAWAILLMMDQ